MKQQTPNKSISDCDTVISKRSISKSHYSLWMVFALVVWLVTCSLWSPPGDCTWSITFPHLHKRLTWLCHEQSSIFCGWLFDIL